MSEFRYNKLTQRWVLFAPNRAKRPTAFNKSEKLITPSEQCPFDVGNESSTPNEQIRIGTKEKWRCRIVPNLYNALSIEDDPVSLKDGCFSKRSGFGAHEVIIETPVCKRQMFEFTIEEFIDYFTIIKLRIEDLRKDIRIKYFSIFKNHGVNGGATIEHSHSQILALPFLPKKIKDELSYIKKYNIEYGRDFFDDLIYDETSFKRGMLFENSSFLAYCPYASQFAFEVLIIAKEKIHSILECKDTQIYALSEITEFVFKKLYNTLGNFDFNMIIKNGQIDLANEKNLNRLHIQILPRLYKTAGFELDSDIYINTFLPETVVKILKDN